MDKIMAVNGPGKARKQECGNSAFLKFLLQGRMNWRKAKH
jgi:hypothetical protein